jgi:hypothetical protein
MTHAEPNLDHPLVEIASRLLMPDPEVNWRFDDQSAAILEAALRSQKDDPTLAGGVLGLFHLATDLIHAHGAHAAAGRIFAVLGAVGAELFNEGEMPPDLHDLIEKTRRSLGMDGRALPPAHDAKPPKGTISARKLLDPLQR